MQEMILDSGLIAPVHVEEIAFRNENRALLESLYSPELREEMTFDEFCSEVFGELSLN